MAMLKDVLTGLKIFEANGGKNICAEHDVIFSGQGDNVNLSADDIKTLRNAGWFIDSEFCGGECREDDDPVGVSDDDDGISHHPACDEWAIFV